MGAAVYIRTVSACSQVKIQLVCAKTKVAPLKRLSIPGLELSAALLLARLVAYVRSTLKLSEFSSFMWTDSTVTLTWVREHPSRWKDFVRNRVSTIQELCPLAEWRFVPRKENPADCASRGTTREQLAHHELWWKGPSWLAQSSQFWPQLEPQPDNKAHLEERPGLSLAVTQAPETGWCLLERYSSLKKLIRITAICQRFIARLKRTPHSSLATPLEPSDLDKARIYSIKYDQHQHFSPEIKSLERQVPLSRTNPLIQLTPFLDHRGVLRVGGRLKNARLDPETTHPPILPRRSHLSTLVISEAHERTLHGGTQATLAQLRQAYWVIGGRAPVRSHVLLCVRCARYRGLRAQQLMGQLPTTSVTPSRPFLDSGVNYAGPFTIQTWRGRAARSYKGYVAVFVCSSTSAVHVEAVSDYSADGFLAGYRRFTGRRGLCASLKSDCGTNFLGARRILKEEHLSASREADKLCHLSANDGTKWLFNPPSAPHFGGKWEAAVKSVKYHLRRVLGDSILTFEEFMTLLVQIESVLNSRPLCLLTDDSEDLEALTPGNF